MNYVYYWIIIINVWIAFAYYLNVKSGNYSELHNVSCSCFKNTSKYCNVTYRIKIQSRPRCSPDRPGQRETLGKFHLFFFPISSAISFKGPNAHIDAPSPTGPRIQSCHRVQGVHGAQPKNAASSTGGRRRRERWRNGREREGVSARIGDTYACVRMKTETRHTGVAELFMMPDRDAVLKQRCLRGRRPGFTHRHSCLPSRYSFSLSLSPSFFPPFATPSCPLFSLANFIRLHTRQLSHLYSLNRFNDEQAQRELPIVCRVLL